MPHRVESNVQTGEVREVELTPEEIAALPPDDDVVASPAPPTKAELLSQLTALQAQIAALPEE
jgi:folate-dependent tRNA-U54 methylase TrmFO/GidA